jgi:hypothetical protein
VTRYGKTAGGVDIFTKSLVYILHYDFIYYVEKILNLAISGSLKAIIQSKGYPIFIPVSSIYHIGKYFDCGPELEFSNTSFP